MTWAASFVLLRVLKLADASAVAERHEALSGEAGDQFKMRLPALSSCRHVDNQELVDLLLVEDADRIQGIADVGGIRELPGLNQTIAMQQERGNDPMLQHANST